MKVTNEQKERWNKQHWITQREYDIDIKPKGCPFCGNKKLTNSSIGWYCDTKKGGCNTELSAVAFYQGRNSMYEQLKSQLKEEELEKYE